jgi:hypothetical protein
LTKFRGFLVMFDLIFGLQQAVEGGVQDKAEIVGYWPLLGPFLGFKIM